MGEKNPMPRIDGEWPSNEHVRVLPLLRYSVKRLVHGDDNNNPLTGQWLMVNLANPGKSG